MIENNKKFFAVYAVWIALHLFLYLTKPSPDFYGLSYTSKECFYPFPNNLWANLWGALTSGVTQQQSGWFALIHYDYTELFVYSVAPLLLLFQYKAFFAKK